ncbi:MAG: 1-(5-phosphoribosyl)-5-[(5-phosphoribosylamino)methylideneamino]imidazole-4-carboxamide isomerase [Ignavibacteriales bacterium]|nr:1-(5-phosphoribosyl)-5-[(5-phosphoribosylamino)methylideneamino]imidazole-4-carboxamide isomerase [Ignavibacteriales bacterium]
MIVIPAIDIFQNKIVRLRQGEFDKIEYYPNSPLHQARIFDEFGFEWLHLVDLLGSKSGEISVKDLIGEIKSETNLKIEFGGGVRNSENVSELLSLGVDKVIIGSLSIQNKNEFVKITEKFDVEKIIVAADVKNEKVVIKGWTEQTSISIFDHIEYCKEIGVVTFLCTDISTDGMLTGANRTLYEKILKKEPGIKLIASGGIKDLQDVIAVKNTNIFGVVIGKAIYENKIDLKELVKIGK